VHYPDHPLYDEFLTVVSNPIFAEPRVWHDFDYEGAAKLTSEEARERLTRKLPGRLDEDSAALLTQ
jgi:hypothetical protein